MDSEEGNISRDPIPQLRLCEPIRMYVCTESGCHVAVKRESLYVHLRRKHNIPKAIAKRNADKLALNLQQVRQSPLENRYLRSPYPNAGERVLPALPILPVFDVLKCPLCSMYCNGKRACNTHLHSRHCSNPTLKIAIESLTTATCVKGQTLFNGNQKLFFPVQLSLRSADARNDAPNSAMNAAASALFDNRPAPGSQTEQIALQDKTQNITSTLLGIPEFLRRHSLSIDRAFEVTNVQCRTTYSNVLELLLLYVKHFADMDPPVPLPIIEFIKIKHGNCQSSFSLSLPPDTKKRYARVVTRFVCAIGQLTSLNIPTFSVPVRLIHQAKKLMSQTPSSAHAILAQMHTFLSSVLLGAVRASHGEKVILEEIFKLVMAGFSRSKEVHRARLGGAEDASHTAAALQYFCHVAALGEFLVQPVGFGIISRNGAESELERREKVKSMIATDACTPAAYIRTVLSKTKRLSAAESPQVKFAMCQSHKYCGSVNNLEIRMNSDDVGSLGYAVRCLQQQSWVMLREELMQNYSVPSGTWDTILSFTDNICARDPGLFFGDSQHSRNIMREWVSKFMLYLANQTTSPVTRSGPQDSPSFLASESAGNWLHLVDKFSRNLYILFHLCCGGPPRVTEMSGMRLRNTPAGHRNLYLYNRQLAVLTSYTKTSNQYEKPKPIARFIDEQTTDLALCFITFIKPLQSFLFLSLYGDRMGTEDYMFCQGGEPLPDGRACEAFRQKLAEQGVPLTVSLYRHYRTGIVKSYMQEFSQLSADSVAFMQAGHSEATANRRYAVVEFNFDTFNAATVEGFRRVSDRWHSMLGISSSSTKGFRAVPAQGAINSTTTDPVQGEMREYLKKPDVSHAVHSSRVHSFLGRKRFSSQPVPPLDNMEGDLEIEAGQSLATDCGLSRKSEGSKSLCVGRKRPYDDMEPPSSREHNSFEKKRFRVDIFQALEKLLSGNIGASLFKSEAQKASIFECAAHGTYNDYENSTMVVLPTGGGKTLCWAAPVLMEQENAELEGKSPRKTIVVVPLKALHQDLLRRCRDYGINALKWEDRFNGNGSVIVCSIEKVNTIEYRDFVTATAVNKMLLRVVVDEVHLIALWKSFRDFAHIRTRLRPGQITVPLVLTTATSPPSLIEDIKESVGAQDCCFKIIRAPTGRKNISYTVLSEPSISDDDMINSCASVIRSEISSMNSEEKVIAFCLTVGDAKKLANFLRMSSRNKNVCTYYGSMSPEERNEQFEKWLCSEGHAMIMVATSAFSCGIDYPKVRVVLHVGGSRSLVEFVQESGRLGRDGTESTSIIVFNREYYLRKSRIVDSWKDRSNYHVYGIGKANQCDAKFGSFLQFATNTTQCRRRLIEPFMDGVNRGPCETNESKCDICLLQFQGGGKPGSTMGVSKKDLEAKRMRAAQTKREVTNSQRQNYTCTSVERVGTFTRDTGDIDSGIRPISDSVKSGMVGNVHREGTARDMEALIWKSQQIARTKCLVCALNRGIESGKECHGQCMRGRCFRCMEPAATHQSKDCNATPKGHKGAARCFFCGIPDSKDIHAPGTFNVKGKCHWELVKNAAFLLWRGKENRKRIMIVSPILRSVGEDYISLGKVLCGGDQHFEKVGLLSIIDHVYASLFCKK